MRKTIDLAFDGEMKPCTGDIDQNGEYVFTSEDGHSIKFPANANLKKVIADHNKANSAEVVLANVQNNDFAEQRKKLENLLG